MSSNAASNAANTQVAASDRAAELQHQTAQDQLAFAKKAWDQNQSNMEPWMAYGRGAVTTLGDLMGIKPIHTAGQDGTPAVDAPAAPAGPTDADLVRHAYNGGSSGSGGGAAPAQAQNSGGGQGAPVDQGQPPPANFLPGDQVDPPSAPQTLTPDAKSQTARIVWPDGSRNEVPSHLVQEYVSLGAQTA